MKAVVPLSLLFLLAAVSATEQVADYYQNIHMKKPQVWPQTYRKAYFACIESAKQKYAGLSSDDQNYQNARTNCQSRYNQAMTGHGIV